MSWKAIVSGTTFDALTVCVTASRRGSATGTTATLGSIVDRREWIARCLRGHAGKGAEQRRLAGVRYANDLDLHRRALVTRAGQEACSAVGENVVTARPSGNETCPRASKGSALSCRDPAAPGMSASSAQPARPKTSLIESAGRPICTWPIRKAAECRDNTVGVRQFTCIHALFPRRDLRHGHDPNETHFLTT